MSQSAGAWSHGICGCLSHCGTCCCGWWCPCILYGKNHDKINGGGCCAPCCIYYLLGIIPLFGCCILPCYSQNNRSRLREGYHLAEAPCGDYCTHCWCGACANCQEGNELKCRGVEQSNQFMTSVQAPMMPPQPQTMQ